MTVLFGFMGARFGRMGAAGGGASDVIAPTLSSPLALPLGDTSGYLSVSTNEANGTLYYVVTTSATPPSAAQVKAGQNDGGTSAVYAGNQSIAATGTKTATATGLSSNTAYYAYFMHEDAVGNQSSVSASSSFTTLTTGTSDTSFDNLIAAMSVAPTDLRKGYYARLIGALYAASVWTKVELLYVLGAHDAQAARLNIKAPSTFALQVINSPTFEVDRGYSGDGVSAELYTAWDAVNDSALISQNNGHIGQYNRTDSSVIAGFGNQTANSLHIYTHSTGSGSRVRVNSSASTAPAGNGTQPLHRVVVRDNDSANHIHYRDGANGTSQTAASAAVSNVDLAIFRVATTSYANNQCFAAHVGGPLTAQNVADLYGALNAFAVAVGADT